MTQHLFAEGFAAPAQYHVPAVRAYRGNPFIEALPPTLEREAAKRAMAYVPEYESSDRNAAAIDREHMASLLSAVRQPVGLHSELHSRLSRLIRNGYVARNPVERFFQPNIDAREQALKVEGKGEDLVVSGSYSLGVGPRPSATGLTFLGLSGIGKSAAIEMCLRLYPQLLVHSAYAGQPFARTQIVWLRLDAPPDGSILALAERFFTAVDALHAALDVPTKYREEYMPARATIQRVIPRMARLAAQHGLGVLVLDEIQDLQARGARAILSFLVQLVNTVGIPVVLVGGIDALPILSTQFRQARRGASEGDLIVRRAERGRDWRAFCEVLWAYQYTREVTPLTDEHLDALYDVSQGITQYLVLAYKLAQVRAIATGIERVTPNIIRSVRDSLAQAAPVLAALRRGDYEVLRRLGDVAVPQGFEGIPFIRGDRPGANGPGSSTPTRPTNSDRPAVPPPPAPPASGPARAASGSPKDVPVSRHETSREPGAAHDGRTKRKAGDGSRAVGGAASGSARAVPKMAQLSPPLGEPAGEVSPLGPTLPELAQLARTTGREVHEVLTEHGVMGDALWERLSGAAGS